MDIPANTTFMGDGDLGVTSSQDPNGLTQPSATNEANGSHSTTPALIAGGVGIVIILLFGALYVAFRHRPRQKARRRKTRDLEAKAGSMDMKEEPHTVAMDEDEKTDPEDLPTIVITSQSMLEDIEEEFGEDGQTFYEPNNEASNKPVDEETSRILVKVASIAENMQKRRSVESLVMTIRSVESKRSSILVDSCTDMFALRAETIDHNGMVAGNGGIAHESSGYAGNASISYEYDSSLESLPPPTPDQKDIAKVSVAALDDSITTSSLNLRRLSIVHESIGEEEKVMKRMPHEVSADAPTAGRKTRSAVRNMPTFLSYDDLLPEQRVPQMGSLKPSSHALLKSTSTVGSAF